MEPQRLGGPKLGTSMIGGPKPWNRNVWGSRPWNLNPKSGHSRFERLPGFNLLFPLYWSYGVFAIETTSAKRLAEKKRPSKRTPVASSNPAKHPVRTQTSLRDARRLATASAASKKSLEKIRESFPFPYPLRWFLGVSIVLNRPFSTFSSSSSGAPGRSAAHPSLFPRRLVDGVPGLGTRLWRVSALPGIVVVVVVVGSQNLPPKKRAAFRFLGERFPRGPGGHQKGFLFFARFFVDTRLPNLGLLACKLQVCQAPALGHSKS